MGVDDSPPGPLARVPTAGSIGGGAGRRAERGAGLREQRRGRSCDAPSASPSSAAYQAAGSRLIESGQSDAIAQPSGTVNPTSPYTGCHGVLGRCGVG